MATAPEAPQDAERVPLDRVMLAMDVVDTLRHQQELVERELNEESRRSEFVARVQGIYDAQGIDVDEDVVREAVQALLEDRFVYQPPKRSLQVRLAEVYVERRKWALRTFVLALVLGALWACYAIPAHYHRNGLIEAYSQRVNGTLHAAERLVARADRLAADVPATDEDRTSWQRQLTEAGEHIETGRARASRVVAALQQPVDAKTYPDESASMDATLAAQKETLASAGRELEAANRAISNVKGLRKAQLQLQAGIARLAKLDLSDSERTSAEQQTDAVEARLTAGDAAAARATITGLAKLIEGFLLSRQQRAESEAEFAKLRAALAGVNVEPDAQREREQLQATIARAFEANDVPRANAAIAQLRVLIRELDLSYQLRIVQNGRSGVWRYHTEDRSIRNYYIVVEAVDENGKVLRLSVESEEDGRTRSVRRFGIRVPEAVYERVKADKLDNRIVDDRNFGEKKRGRRAPEYRFKVAGGRITRW